MKKIQKLIFLLIIMGTLTGCSQTNDNVLNQTNTIPTQTDEIQYEEYDSIQTLQNKKDELLISFTNPDIPDDVQTLNISPAVEYLDDKIPGKTLIETLTIQAPKNTFWEVKVIDFDLDRQNCDNRTPIIGESSSNSARNWVSLEDQGRKENGKNEIGVIIDIPPKAIKKTYWFGIQVQEINDQKTIVSSAVALYFVTVGNERSEQCLK
ncbi:hypothetical protein GF362_03565 [Candidatus Dojkabacteria bacterium]|nr:hypothetical protein [Candidatus Dojkabacteria bacterium]